MHYNETEGLTDWDNFAYLEEIPNTTLHSQTGAGAITLAHALAMSIDTYWFSVSCDAPRRFAAGGEGGAWGRRLNANSELKHLLHADKLRGGEMPQNHGSEQILLTELVV